MKILVINAGSSSLKYQLIDMTNEGVLAKGNCERIGIDGLITHKTDTHADQHEADFPTHAEAFRELVRMLTTGDHKVIADMSEITAVGHRVVQGAEMFSSSVRITDDMLADLETISDLAPLHNPAHIIAIRACQSVFDKSVPQVAVFDTAFHQSIPQKAFMYPIPYEMYEKYHIRKYGFHGTSHRYVSAKLAEHVGKPLEKLKIVTCHLGNGSSITAVDGGKSVDTSMGFTPLDGIIMGTRSGSIDPSIVTYIQEKENMGPKEVNDLLNKKSGYLGVSGVTSDQRDLVDAAAKGNARAQLSVDLQRSQIKKYIGSYAAAMGGLDYVIFTGGIGENSAETRRDACKNMEFMGIEIDEALNQSVHGDLKDISAPNARVRVMVVPTNEELLIARDTMEIVNA
ncbi:MAG: acetate kinase [Oscillospiraceae bacterium]|jgi:acetate kinase|nr:acetate kinase [Oscillospiraceae bacterium]